MNSQYPPLTSPRVLAGFTIVLALTAAGSSHAAVPSVLPVVKRTYPHDPQAFTQGLLWVGETLYESTGLYGSSTLREVSLSTGAVQQSHSLAPNEFGEGLALVDQRLIQLTWKSGRAHVYDRDSFQLVRSFEYTGEGWGLCFDGNRLVMSDGSSSLFFREPSTFDVTGSVVVTRDGYRVQRLNELECVNGWVYANVWQTKQIVKIDPRTGEVNATITADNLLTPEESAAADVLNGIAYEPTTRRFAITGKLWPKLFEVELPGAAAPDPAPPKAVASEPTTAPGSDAEQAAPHPSGQVPANSPPKVNAGCHCAIAGDRRPHSLAWVVVALTWIGASGTRRRRSVRSVPLVR